MHLADLPEALATVVLQRRALVEMHRHRELPGLDLQRKPGRGEAGAAGGALAQAGSLPLPQLSDHEASVWGRQLNAPRAPTCSQGVLAWWELMRRHLPGCPRPGPGRYLDDRGRRGKEPLVLGEVLHPQRGRHDDELQWQEPL